MAKYKDKERLLIATKEKQQVMFTQKSISKHFNRNSAGQKEVA